MRLYVNESTGYFGTADPDCALVATLNTIRGHGDREAAKLLGVRRRELYSDLFRVSERWEEVAGQDIHMEEIPELIERFFEGRIYGIGYFGDYKGSDTVPEGMERYFVIEKGIRIPFPSVLVTDVGKRLVVNVDPDGNVINQRQAELPGRHAYAYLKVAKKFGIYMNELVDSDGT